MACQSTTFALKTARRSWHRILSPTLSGPSAWRLRHAASLPRCGSDWRRLPRWLDFALGLLRSVAGGGQRVGQRLQGADYAPGPHAKSDQPPGAHDDERNAQDRPAAGEEFGRHARPLERGPGGGDCAGVGAVGLEFEQAQARPGRHDDCEQQKGRQSHGALGPQPPVAQDADKAEASDAEADGRDHEQHPERDRTDHSTDESVHGL